VHSHGCSSKSSTAHSHQTCTRSTNICREILASTRYGRQVSAKRLTAERKTCQILHHSSEHQHHPCNIIRPRNARLFLHQSTCRTMLEQGPSRNWRSRVRLTRAGITQSPSGPPLQRSIHWRTPCSDREMHGGCPNDQTVWGNCVCEAFSPGGASKKMMQSRPEAARQRR
jgi:hypothetical protein